MKKGNLIHFVYLIKLSISGSSFNHPHRYIHRLVYCKLHHQKSLQKINPVLLSESDLVLQSNSDRVE